MKNNALIQAENRNGNLHIKLYGGFDHHSAGQLTTAINDNYLGRGNIFVHTEKLEQVFSSGGDHFKREAVAQNLPCKVLYLTGEKGLEMAPEGCRVIVGLSGKKTCSRSCQNCKCKNNVGHHHNKKAS